MRRFLGSCLVSAFVLSCASNAPSTSPHPTAGAVPNIETPLQMSLTPTVDPVAAPLLGEHTREVLQKTLGYDERRIAALAEAGAFGKPGNTA